MIWVIGMKRIGTRYYNLRGDILEKWMIDKSRVIASWDFEEFITSPMELGLDENTERHYGAIMAYCVG